MAEKSSYDLGYTHVPLGWIDSVRISGNVTNDEAKIPLATYETPLWPSCGRGVKVSRMVEGGITCTSVGRKTVRLVIPALDSAVDVVVAHDNIPSRPDELKKIVEPSPRFAKLVDIHLQVVPHLLFVRFNFFSSDASSRNMATLTSERLMLCLMEQMPELDYGSISGNHCTDRKVPVANGILGHGEYMIAEAIISEPVVRKRLYTTAERLTELNEHKNLVGFTMVGSLRSDDAHYASMPLGPYLAIGQDTANTVKGPQGLIQAEASDDGSVCPSHTLPHLIVGSVGSGKGLDFAEKNLTALGCKEDRESGKSVCRPAACYAATIWRGELSLFAEQTNPGEPMEAHVSTERMKQYFVNSCL